MYIGSISGFYNLTRCKRDPFKTQILDTRRAISGAPFKENTDTTREFYFPKDGAVSEKG